MPSKKLVILLLMYLSLYCEAFAGIVISGTRVIYPSSKAFVSVQIENIGKEPALVQAWVDRVDESLDLSGIKAPFIVTPPLKTVDSNKGKALRVIFNQKELLPKDRESLFWFNVLDIPTKPENLQNYIQFAVRSKLKLFFRPDEIKISQDDEFKQFNINIEKDYYILSNPTPYYINFGKK